MAKIDSKDLKKALALIEKEAGAVVVDMSFDTMNRLLIKYIDTMGGDAITIVIFDANTEKMAEITRTSRL